MNTQSLKIGFMRAGLALGLAMLTWLPQASLAKPEVKSKFERDGLILRQGGPAEMRERLDRELATWKPILESIAK
ncbi:MAG: hypothetical protein Q7T63_03900 [Burkholderiaceae bacterium]|nr:hypothetical protein [Burkholderiaceae bacterium]MDO9089820.1 hypothetical protein [Burkholderiaceae bacterium]